MGVSPCRLRSREWLAQLMLVPLADALFYRDKGLP